MWLLSLIRWLRRIKYRVFGKRLPAWLTDGMSLVRHVNLVRLVPATYMAAVHPYHFFKSVPSILARKKPYYPTPLQFLSNLAILQLLVLAWFLPNSPAYDKEGVVMMNLALVAVSPLVVAIFCAMLLFLWVIAYAFSQFSRVLIGMFSFNMRALLIPLSIWSYSKMDWRHYLWSLFYFYGYFYFTLIVIGVLFFQVLGLAIDTILELTRLRPSTALVRIEVAAFCVVSVFSVLLGYLVVVRPYVYLMFAATREFTPQMSYFRLYEIQRAREAKHASALHLDQFQMAAISSGNARFDQKTTSDDAWTCPNCQEGLEGQFSQCWKCQTRRPLNTTSRADESA